MSWGKAMWKLYLFCWVLMIGLLTTMVYVFLKYYNILDLVIIVGSLSYIFGLLYLAGKKISEEELDNE